MKKAPQVSAVQEMVTVETAVEPAEAVVEATAPKAAPTLPDKVVAEPVWPADPQPEQAVEPTRTPTPAPATPAPATPAPATPAPATPAPVKKSEKEGYKKTGNGWQSPEQWNRTRSTYGATRHLTGHLSLADYITAALEFYDQHIEEKFNNGEPFDFNPMNIPQGRPVGSTNTPKG